MRVIIGIKNMTIDITYINEGNLFYNKKEEPITILVNRFFFYFYAIFF